MSDRLRGGSAERPYIDKAHPDVYAALLATAKASRRASEGAGVEPALLELVNARVSQINGCVTCLSIHLPAARKAGVSEQELDLLPAWRDAEVYSEAQRAALGLAEAITRPHEHDLAQAQRVASACFSTDAVAALEWGTILINSFNRVSIASGHPARDRG